MILTEALNLRMEGLQKGLGLDAQIFDLLPDEIPIRIRGRIDIAHKGDQTTREFETPDGIRLFFDQTVECLAVEKREGIG
jgi:hypothetical protein